MSNNASSDEVNERMQQAVQEAANELWPGDMVTKMIIIAEVLDGDTGERTSAVATAPGTTVWDAAGLLQFGVQLQQAEIINGFRRDE